MHWRDGSVDIVASYGILAWKQRGPKGGWGGKLRMLENMV